MSKLPSHIYLDEHNIPYEAKTFPESTEKGAANVAHALGFRERQMVKTLIFTIAKTEEHIMVMVGGDQNVKSGFLKKAAGSRNIKMTAPETVLEVTGYAIGSIPPFHWQAEGFRSFIAESLMSETELGVGTGQWGHEIIITPENLVKASNAIIVPLVAD